jgi:hypothetical protein
VESEAGGLGQAFAGAAHPADLASHDQVRPQGTIERAGGRGHDQIGELDQTW